MNRLGSHQNDEKRMLGVYLWATLPRGVPCRDRRGNDRFGKMV